MADHGDLKLRPADTTAGKRIFDFFGLPPELRNEVYSMLTEDVEVQNGYHGDEGEGTRLHVTAKNKLLLTPLLLNHQFKEEYEQETKPRETLILKDAGCDLENIKPWRYTSGPTRVRATLLLVLDADCVAEDECGCHSELEGHVVWLKCQIETLGHVQDVKVELRPCYREPVDTKLEVHAREALEKLFGMLPAPDNVQVEVFPLFQHARSRPQETHLGQTCAYRQMDENRGVAGHVRADPRGNFTVLEASS